MADDSIADPSVTPLRGMASWESPAPDLGLRFTTNVGRPPAESCSAHIFCKN